MKQALNILHTESSTGWGGQELRILNEALGFRERGHHVTIACPREAELFGMAQAAKIPLAILPMHKKRMHDLAAVRRYLKASGGDFDVINTHSSTDSWLVALATKMLHGMPPIVRTRHVSTAVNKHLSTRWLYTRATAHIVTTGEALRQQLHSHNGYALTHMTSVPTGIDLAKYHPLDRIACRNELDLSHFGINSDTPVIGIVATLRDWKGHTVLFAAMPAILQQFPNAKIIVVGDGPYEPTLRRTVQEMELQKCVHFVGRRNDVPRWLNAFDIFTLPSWGDEGVPQAIMQAMACAKAVVSTHVGAIHEAVQDGVTGTLITPRNTEQLAQALIELLRNRNKQASYAEAAQRYAQANFSAGLMVEKMEAVFYKVFKKKL